jgi:pyridoxal phosphate enzyme (YggS family)
MMSIALIVAQKSIVQIRSRIAAAAGSRPVALLAVSKARSADDVRALATHGGHWAFGENYVQEAARKSAALVDLSLEWHLIGHLQSNKCAEAARVFDWIESIDRTALLAPLSRHRPADRGPLQLLIQVNVDDEASKSGCKPEQVPALTAAIGQYANLQLRGLMAIPAPSTDPSVQRAAFITLAELFERLRASHPAADTLSMGMSDDFELALREGATEVRIGTALFGPRI